MPQKRPQTHAVAKGSNAAVARQVTAGTRGCIAVWFSANAATRPNQASDQQSS